MFPAWMFAAFTNIKGANYSQECKVCLAFLRHGSKFSNLVAKPMLGQSVRTNEKLRSDLIGNNFPNVQRFRKKVQHLLVSDRNIYTAVGWKDQLTFSYSPSKRAIFLLMKKWKLMQPPLDNRYTPLFCSCDITPVFFFFRIWRVVYATPSRFQLY